MAIDIGTGYFHLIPSAILYFFFLFSAPLLTRVQLSPGIELRPQKNSIGFCCILGHDRGMFFFFPATCDVRMRDSIMS